MIWYFLAGVIAGGVGVMKLCAWIVDKYPEYFMEGWNHDEDEDRGEE